MLGRPTTLRAANNLSTKSGGLQRIRPWGRPTGSRRRRDGLGRPEGPYIGETNRPLAVPWSESLVGTQKPEDCLGAYRLLRRRRVSLRATSPPPDLALADPVSRANSLDPVTRVWHSYTAVVRRQAFLALVLSAALCPPKVRERREAGWRTTARSPGRTVAGQKTTGNLRSICEG